MAALLTSAQPRVMHLCSCMNRIKLGNSLGFVCMMRRIYKQEFSTAERLTRGPDVRFHSLATSYPKNVQELSFVASVSAMRASVSFAIASLPRNQRTTQRFRGTPTPHGTFVACRKITPSGTCSAAHGGAPELSRWAARVIAMRQRVVAK